MHPSPRSDPIRKGNADLKACLTARASRHPATVLRQMSDDQK
ncbi:hypothetical protein [Azospirillum endophyticum]